MKLMKKCGLNGAARLLLVLGVSTVLVACGGSSGDETVDGGLDGGIDGGIDGGLDGGIDGNGGIDEGAASNGSDGSPLNCGDANGGTDPDSSTASWADNCVISSTGPFADSYYSRGIQRILFCNGFANGAATIGAFADAEYGPGTAMAVTSFQNGQEPPLTPADGIVGPITWSALFDSLRYVTTTTDGFDAYAVGNQCGDDIQFYQSFAQETDEDGDPVVDGDGNPIFSSTGWTIADNPNSPTRVEFSVRNPFN